MPIWDNTGHVFGHDRCGQLKTSWHRQNVCFLRELLPHNIVLAGASPALAKHSRPDHGNVNISLSPAEVTTSRWRVTLKIMKYFQTNWTDLLFSSLGAGLIGNIRETCQTVPGLASWRDCLVWVTAVLTRSVWYYSNISIISREDQFPAYQIIGGSVGGFGSMTPRRQILGDKLWCFHVYL